MTLNSRLFSSAVSRSLAVPVLAVLAALPLSAGGVSVDEAAKYLLILATSAGSEGRVACKELDMVIQLKKQEISVDAKAKITQCWRRLAESELMVGIFMVKNRQFVPAEIRLKNLMETYPEYVDRERAYYYLGETLRQRPLAPEQYKQFNKDYAVKIGKEENTPFTKEEQAVFSKEFFAFLTEETDKFKEEAKGYYQKLVESYPGSECRANDRLLEMGQAGRKEELDS